MEYDDELVLMIGDQVRVLAGLGLLAWLALESPRTLDEVVAEVTSLWGDHPDARRLVEDALGELAEQDVVERPS